jgi:hypothetical protein
MSPRRRRFGFVLAATIAGLAVAIAALPSLQSVGPGELSGPSIVPRLVFIALLLGLPAGVAAIAALRGSRPLFVAAGLLCLFQSFVAFSGVTLGFVLPGFLLIGLGVSRSSIEPTRPVPRRAWLAGVLVVSLGIAAWIAPFATSEEVCWIARPGPNGEPVYTIIPNSDTLTVGPGDLGSGCDGGAFSLEGLLLAGFLGIGALAIAGLGAGGVGGAGGAGAVGGTGPVGGTGGVGGASMVDAREERNA